MSVTIFQRLNKWTSFYESGMIFMQLEDTLSYFWKSYNQ